MTTFRGSLTELQRAQKTSKGAPAYSRLVNRPLGRVFAAVAHVAGATPNMVTAISAGFTSACGVRSNGAVVCWGYDGGGRLGDGELGSPEFDPTPSATIGVPTTREVATGVGQACARTASAAGPIWCWGDDSFGQLGDGTVGSPAFNPTPKLSLG